MITVTGENIMIKGCFSEPKEKYLTCYTFRRHCNFIGTKKNHTCNRTGVNVHVVYVIY